METRPEDHKGEMRAGTDSATRKATVKPAANYSQNDSILKITVKPAANYHSFTK
jgi:hypothetical protein